MNLVNVSVIKDLVDEVIKLVEELIEEHGMFGETEMVVSFEADLSSLRGMKEELSTLQNVDIHPVFILKSIKEHVPSLDMDLIHNYLSMLITRKTHVIDVLYTEIKVHELLVDLIVSSDNK